ncbi:MAG: sulfate adenylyltransferase subunit CysN [Bryobacteraceae bacterium]
MAAQPLVEIEPHLVASPQAEELQKDLLRFTTAGSVDDGKSTLIGRLLFDSRAVFEDQLQAVAKASSTRGNGALDLSLLTDGLRAEREQGITIDVAYRYFATARRKFIIADTPGHEQYTRNMATGASTADLAIILIDARHGVLAQSRRHAYISRLLGIERVVVAVNKMDLVGFDESVFLGIEKEFGAFLDSIGQHDSYFIPLSALNGDNVVTRSLATPWFFGASLLEHLETVKVARHASSEAGFRMPVQMVIRPHQDFRGFAGQIAGGTVRLGQEVVALPSGKRSRVASISTFDGELEAAFAPMSVTLTLADEIDISRGDTLAAVAHPPHVGTTFEADLVWMSETPLDRARPLLLKQTTQTVKARVEAVANRVDVVTLERSAAASLAINAIGVVRIESAKPLVFDAYAVNRPMGGFILIDPETNATIAAGMIRTAIERRRSGGGPVTAAERVARHGHRGAILAIGDRRDVEAALERKLFDQGCAIVALDRDTTESTIAQLRDSAFVVLLRSAPAKALPEDCESAMAGLYERLRLEGVFEDAGSGLLGEGI